jgi:hypothetical protein
LRRLWAELLKARREWPALRDRRHTSTRLIRADMKAKDGSEALANPSHALRRDEDTPAVSPILVIERGSGDQGLAAWANLSPTSHWVPDLDLGRRRFLLSTEEPRFGGLRDQPRPPQHLLPYELLIAGPAELRP